VAGTIIADVIQSDQSYPSSINIASPVIISNTFAFPAGTVSAPAFFPTGDTNTGIFFPAADTMAFAEGGVEAMRIDSSGRVGIGTSSPGARLHIQGPQNGIQAVFYGAGTTGRGLELRLDNRNATNAASIFNGIGAGAGELVFETDSVERGRFTYSGYFKASNNGTYVNSTNIFHELVQSSGNQWNSIISNSASSGALYGALLTYTGQTPNNTTSEFFRCEDTTNTKLSIFSNGTVTNRTGTYNSFSDLKLKQDVVNASSQWDDIKALRVVNYRLKDEVAADPNYPAYIGLIAQEVEQVSPGLVDECPDLEEVEVTDEEGNVTTERQATGTVTKAVKYSVLYMKAVKALQEAIERIETLEAKNDALETRIAALEESQP